MTKLSIVRNNNKKEAVASLRKIADQADRGEIDIDGLAVVGVSSKGQHSAWLSGRCRHSSGIAIAAVANLFQSLANGG